MCLKESFFPFSRDALNFSAAENICRTTQQCSCFTLPQPSSLRRVTLRSIVHSYHSAQLPLMLTGKAESAQIKHRQETLVYLSLFAVALLCCGTADLGNAGQISFTDQLPAICSAHMS